MWGIIDILKLSSGAMFAAIACTIAGVILLINVIQRCNKDKEFTPVSFVVGLVLYLLWNSQSMLIAGAICVKSYCNDIEDGIQATVNYLSAGTGVNGQDCREVIERIDAEWPIAGEFINLEAFSKNSPETLAKDLADELHSSMNTYILKRIGWSLFFVVVGSFLLVRSMETKRQARRRKIHARQKVYED